MSATRSDREAPSLAPPGFIPSLLVTLAVHMLPGGSRRNRYRREFLAELYGMPTRRQTAHALRILASSWSLRRATVNPARERTTMLTMLRSKPLLCLLNIKHYWMPQYTDEGTRYERCAACGKDRWDYPWYGTIGTWS